jgi:hypothetical protein
MSVRSLRDQNFAACQVAYEAGTVVLIRSLAATSELAKRKTRALHD